MWLVGNSISKICPYIPAWGLEDIVKKLKQGEIATKTIHNEANDVTIAIEYCKPSGGKQMAVGNAKSMIDRGSWQTNPQPHLEKSYKNYIVLYRIVFYFKGFMFLGEYLKDKEEPLKKCWFIRPKYSDIQEKTIVISDVIKNSKWWQRDIYQMTGIKNEKLKKFLYNTFRENIIFYSDDLCGTDFKQAIDFLIKR